MMRALLLSAALLLPGIAMAQMNNAPLVSTSAAGVVSGTYGHFQYVSTTNLTVNGLVFSNGGGAGDRISTTNVASGATLGMVVADKGTVSFTLAGTAGAAYIHPTLGFVGPGVSTTGAINGTSFVEGGTSLVSKYGQLNNNNSWTAVNYFLSNKGAASTLGANSTYALEAFANDGGAAAMSFHRSGAYAVNIGLDPDNVFRIGGWSAAANVLQLDMNGNLTVTAYLHSSDRRLKDNIVPVADPMGLLNGINGVHFTWKKDGRASYGVIAQDVQKVMPEAVRGGGSTTLVVDSDQLIAPLIEAVKIQQKQIDDLRREVDELRAKQAGR